MEKVRWGVLSTANIGTEKVIPAMMQSDKIEMVGISSRSQENAQAAADKLGIPKAYGSYEDLLADPEIEAIYNPLPNQFHVDWSIKALQAGKHVLCEKPIGLSSEEGQRLVDEGVKHPQLKLMEAFMYRHHPQWVTAKNWVKEGRIGDLVTIQSFFSYFNDDPGNIRNQLDAGGGALMDIGCYNISLSRFIFEEEPSRVSSTIERDKNFGTDILTSAMMQFPGGTGTFTCSTQMVPYQRVNIFGTKGRIEIEIPFNAPPDKKCKMWFHNGSECETKEFDICDQYEIQGTLMSEAIRNDTAVPTPICDAVQNMKVIEAVFASASDGEWKLVK